MKVFFLIKVEKKNLTLPIGVEKSSLYSVTLVLLSKLSYVKVAQSYPTLCIPRDYTIHGILQARILEWVAVPFSRASSQPRIEPRSPTWQVDSFPPEPLGKPWDAGVSSIFLLQQIFLTLKSSQGLPPCRWILYHLSYQGIPNYTIGIFNSHSSLSHKCFIKRY